MSSSKPNHLPKAFTKANTVLLKITGYFREIKYDSVDEDIFIVVF